jgi:uncharacterized membrane protein
MNLDGALKLVMPPRRRPVTAAALLPLVLFMAAFGAACVALQATGRMVFVSPAAFLLTAAMPWAWWHHHGGRSGLRGMRSLVALMVRLAFIGAFVMLLAEPRAVRRSDVLSVVYAVDMSDSIGAAAADASLSFVTRTVSEKPEKDEAGLVVFGANAAVELPPRVSFPLEAVNSRVITDATDLGKGLSLAGTMIPADRSGRIVLISDGVQTEGDLSAVLDELRSRRIPVDVLPIQYGYDREVWLEKLELPRFVRVGETYEAAVVLSSLQPGGGTLTLTENGQVIYEGQVEFEAGKNRYVLPLHLREPGYYEYVAAVEVPPGEDGWRENNRAVNHLYLKGEGKLLLVTDPTGDTRDWQPLSGALGKARFVVERGEAYDFPRDVMSLLPYDCIVFVNVPADAFDEAQMETLHDAVYNQGTGFLMVGGPNSFGPGGYNRTPVEKALPVTMDISQKKVLPKGALVIILHTCEFPEGNTWGKRIAKEAMRVLSAQDEVGVLADDWQRGEGWVFPLTPASRYEELVPLINSAEIGDMSSFGTTMQMGLTALQASDAAMKHMIIISDGDPSPPTPELLAAFVQARVSVSTVTISPHGQQDVPVMTAIASVTGGRHYFPQDSRLLPSIFVKEAKTLKRSMIQNVTFVPSVSAPSPILKGIDALPPLHGYVLTSPKGRASTVLKGPETEQVDPVLAVWRYGVGKATAFTSDLSANWASDWVPWERYQAFVHQLVSDVARTDTAGYLQMEAMTSGNEGVVYVEDAHPGGSFLEVEAWVKGPHGREELVRLRQSGPRRYEGRFPLWGKGRYQVVAAGAGDGRSERVVGGIAVAYSPEYLRFRADPATLEQIAARTGGRVLTGRERGEDIFPKERKSVESSRPVSDLFLIAMACLLPLDVAVRRVQLDWALIRGWLSLGRAPAASTETMSALLRRKRAIQFGPPEQERPGEPEAPAARPTRAAGTRPRAEPSEEAAEQERRSTTERLLDMKKKWQRRDDK